MKMRRRRRSRREEKKRRKKRRKRRGVGRGRRGWVEADAKASAEDGGDESTEA